MDKDALVFVIGTLLASAFLLIADPGFASGLAVAATAFSGLWLVSLRLRNASIVDVFWGAGFVLLGLFYFTQNSASSGFRGPLVLAMVIVWGLRLALHIGIRNAGAGEDFRYAAWRDETGAAFWWISYFKVFLLQAVVLWIVSSPLLLAWRDGSAEAFGVVDALGICLWLFGFIFESVADLQLVLFKRQPSNKGKILTTGLWSYSRHPNYFGEAVLWWGIGLVAAPAGGWLAFVGPALITFSLVRVSGVAMLDAGMVQRRPEYADYIRKTSSFVPLRHPQRKNPPTPRGS